MYPWAKAYLSCLLLFHSDGKRLRDYVMETNAAVHFIAEEKNKQIRKLEISNLN